MRSWSVSEEEFREAIAKASCWNEAADLLGYADRDSLRYRVKRLGLDVSRFAKVPLKVISEYNKTRLANVPRSRKPDPRIAHVGTRVGHTTILAFLGSKVDPGRKDGKKGTFYLYRCDCGREFEKPTWLAKRLSFCGQDCPILEARPDLSGQRFGSLEVIAKIQKDHENRNLYYLCRCDCGKEVSIGTYDLRRGIRIKCGNKCPLLHKDFIETFRSSRSWAEFRQKMGDKLGAERQTRHLKKKAKALGLDPEQLTTNPNLVRVISDDELREAVRSVYTMSDLLKTLKTTQRDSLTKRIEELKIDRSHWGRRDRPSRDPVETMRYNYAQCAKGRDLPFELSLEEFRNIITTPCFYCGKMGTRKIKEEDHPLNGVDRVDNAKHYSLDNCVSCCPDCNSLKHAVPLFIVQKIAKLQLSKDPSWMDRDDLPIERPRRLRRGRKNAA